MIAKVYQERVETCGQAVILVDGFVAVKFLTRNREKSSRAYRRNGILGICGSDNDTRL
jgi:hypothetical protein